MKMTIDTRFANVTIREMLLSFHLGKEKLKLLKVKLNDCFVNLNELLKEADQMEIIYPEEVDFLPMDGHLDILYEDDNLLIVNKPAGLLVHPDDKLKNGTLVNLVAAYYLKSGQRHAVRYLHRIDYDTTGIVVFTKDILTASMLAYLNEEQRIVKKYLCIASGKFTAKNGYYDFKIAEDRHIANKKRVSKTGKEAYTEYQVLEVLSHNLNLCEATLKTGRTHQIRLHFSYAGHPLLGDKLYNGNPNLLARQALHASYISFISPVTNKTIEITCKLPQDMQKIINKYKKRF